MRVNELQLAADNARTDIFYRFCSRTLTLTRWPSYTYLTRITWRCIKWSNTNFLCQGFWKLSSDRHRQTDRTKII